MRILSLVEGMTLDQDAREQIARKWNWLRIAAAAPALPMGLAVAIFVDSKLYLGVGLMAVVLAISFHQREQPRPAALLGVDTFGTWLVVELLGVPPSVLGIPFTVIWVVAWLTTKGRSRLAVMVGGAIAYALAAFTEAFPVPPPESAAARIIGSVVGAYYVVLLFSVLIATVDVFRSPQVSLAEARDELQRLIASKDEFVASVSHELRTPLTGVVGFASELNRSWDVYSELDRREMIRLIAEQGEDVAEIIDDLLTAARADAGTLIVELEEVDVSNVAAAVAQLEGLGFEFDEQVSPARADPVRLRQVLRNLVTNARRYGGSHRWIEVGQLDHLISIRMCDDGEGIPGSNPERVFQAYERSHEAIGQPGSVGLGLAVARTLSRLMGGDLSYRREGATTVFECTLPAAAVRRDTGKIEQQMAS